LIIGKSSAQVTDQIHTVATGRDDLSAIRNRGLRQWSELPQRQMYEKRNTARGARV